MRDPGPRLRGSLVALLLALALVGCQSPAAPEDERRPETAQEKELRVLTERVLAAPRDPAARFALGLFLDEVRESYPAALEQYLAFQRLLDEAHPEAASSTGHFHLGRLYFKLNQPVQALVHLQQVLALRPGARVEAARDRQFAEAHLLVGAIYVEDRQWELAARHLVEARELGLDLLRIEPLLARVRLADPFAVPFGGGGEPRRDLTVLPVFPRFQALRVADAVLACYDAPSSGYELSVWRVEEGPGVLDVYVLLARPARGAQVTAALQRLEVRVGAARDRIVRVFALERTGDGAPGEPRLLRTFSREPR